MQKICGSARRRRYGSNDRSARAMGMTYDVVWRFCQRACHEIAHCTGSAILSCLDARRLSESNHPFLFHLKPQLPLVLYTSLHSQRTYLRRLLPSIHLLHPQVPSISLTLTSNLQSPIRHHSAQPYCAIPATRRSRPVTGTRRLRSNHVVACHITLRHLFDIRISWPC